MKKRKTLWVALFVLVLGLAVVGYLGVNSSKISSQASISATPTPKPTPTCTKKNVVNVTITGGKGQLIDGAKVKVHTPDCNREDETDRDTKVAYETYCTTGEAGKGSCTVDVKLGNYNYSNYYIIATLTSGGKITFKAPPTTWWDRVKGVVTEYYLHVEQGNPYAVTIQGSAV